MSAIKYVFAMLLMTGVLYACAVGGDGDDLDVASQIDQGLIVGGGGGCDDGFVNCSTEAGVVDCRTSCGGDPTGGGGGGGGFPTGGPLPFPEEEDPQPPVGSTGCVFFPNGTLMCCEVLTNNPYSERCCLNGPSPYPQFPGPGCYVRP